MKRLIPLVAALLLVGCATTALDNAGKTIASTALTVDATMKGWATYVVINHPPPPQEDVVRAEYTKYQSVMKTVKVLYAEAAAQPTNAPALTASISVLEASKNSLLGLVAQFSQPKP